LRIASLHIGHDSSASFFDGENLAFFLEERFSKIKHDHRYDICLQKLLELEIKFDFLIICSFDNMVLNSLGNNFRFKQFISEYQKKWGESIRIIFDHSHHRHHASLAFYNSLFDKSLVIVVDGSGQNEGYIRECESVYIAEYPNKFTPIYKNYLIISGKDCSLDLEKVKLKYPDCECTAKSILGIASLYGSCAAHFGEDDVKSAGKVMGLQSYGNETNSNFIKDKIYIDDSDFFIDYKKLACYNKNLPVVNKITEENYKIYADYARDLQVQTESVMTNLIQFFVKKTGIKNVCISGGYGMNVIANFNFVKKFPDLQFYNEPLSMDCGISLGCCFYYYRDKTKDMKMKPIKSQYFHGGLTKID
jgi:carbamoyltransferase